MRIKGVRGNEVFYSDSGYFLDGSLIYLRCVDRFGEYVERLVDAIYRSTGMKDLTGTEIFEGDIVMADDNRGKGEILFYKGCFMVKFNEYYYVPLYLVDCYVVSNA